LGTAGFLAIRCPSSPTPLPGDDALFGGAGSDNLYGDAETVVGTVASAPAGDDRLFGAAGDDTLYGDTRHGSFTSGGNDELFGGTGTDLLVGGRGEDLIDGAQTWIRRPSTGCAPHVGTN
jgi:Ca2+-binding RTX toxin-like protein